MAITYTAIATTTITSNTTTVNFTNLPVTYDDLTILVSADGEGFNASDIYMRFNGNASDIYQRVYIWKDGASATPTTGIETNRASIWIGYGTGSNTTANAFSNASIYIPNFQSNLRKSVRIDCVTAGMNNDQWLLHIAGTWVNTSAITSINIIANQNMVPNTTFSLYGIKKA